MSEYQRDVLTEVRMQLGYVNKASKSACWRLIDLSEGLRRPISAIRVAIGAMYGWGEAVPVIVADEGDAGRPPELWWRFADAKERIVL